MAHRSLSASKNLDVRERLKTKKLTAPRASSANWPQPLTYLVYAPLQHTPMSSLIILSGAIVLGAPATFQSRKPPTLSRRSSLQN